MLVFILFLEVPGSNISFEGYREITKHHLLGGLDHKIRLEGRDGELWVDGGVAKKWAPLMSQVTEWEGDWSCLYRKLSILS